MRTFIFIGNPIDYGNRKGLVNGMVYNENYKPYSTGDQKIKSIFRYKKYENEQKDWSEIFDSQSKKHHKDTDLGYYTEVAFNCLFSKSEFYVKKHGTDKWMEELIKHSIEVSKEIIHNLDNAYK